MLHRLVDWWHSRPPVVVFVLTLAACAFTLASIAVYVNVHKNTMPDPNVKNWNSFFNSLSKLQICIPVQPVQTDNLKTEDGNYIVLVGVSLTTAEGAAFSTSLLAQHRLQMLVSEEQLGRRVPIGQKSKSLMISIGLPTSDMDLPSSSSSQEDDNDDDNNKEKNNDKSSLRNGKEDGTGIAVACVNFVGSSRLLPNAMVLPIPCQQKELPLLPVNASLPCAHEAQQYRLHFHTQRHLTQLLTQEETILIELHLIYTSCALVLLVLLLLGYAICRRTEPRSPHSATTSSLLTAAKHDKPVATDI